MKRNVLLSFMIAAAMCLALSSCGKYKELPFGGMNGRVQQVTIWHLMPEIWYANQRGSDIMYINKSIYDVYGNEICSAVMDSIERVQAEAESLFEDGVCVRSTQKSGSRTIARLNLISNQNGTLTYSKEMNGRTVRMTVKESNFMRRILIDFDVHDTRTADDDALQILRVVVLQRAVDPETVAQRRRQQSAAGGSTNEGKGIE